MEERIAIYSTGTVICHDKQTDPSAALERAAKAGYRSVVSFGVAGGLAPELRAGDWIVASAVLDQGRTLLTDPFWSSKLLMAIPYAIYAPIAGVDSAIVHAAARTDLHARTGAVAVDNESHMVAKAAAAHALRFVALRVVIDAAHQRVPQLALDCVRSDGSISASSLLRSLASCPRETYHLLRLTIDWFAAKKSLVMARRYLGHPDASQGEHGARVFATR
jgi:uridine phosphorylase